LLLQERPCIAAVGNSSDSTAALNPNPVVWLSQAAAMTKQEISPAGAAVGIHATGQPDTPVEVLTHLLQTALKQKKLDDTHSIVQQALDIVGGEQHSHWWSGIPKANCGTESAEVHCEGFKKGMCGSTLGSKVH
jgi:hypothetical protein